MTIYRMTDAKNNAELIKMAADLGYIPNNDDDWVLDPTWGTGRFWRNFTPKHLIRADINVINEDGSTKLGVCQTDFTDMPWGSGRFAAVVFDPPYKLNGTPAMGGPATSDASYGVGTAQSIGQRMDLIFAGIEECFRVVRRDGFVLVKCQDQVSSGEMRWQTFDIVELCRTLCAAELVDMLHLPGVRSQPKGRAQVHAHSNYSTLLIFRATA